MKQQIFTTSRLKCCIKAIIRDLKRFCLMILAVIVYLILCNLLFHKICPVALLTGYPCPGCGMTRAITLFFTLHWVDAFMMHPMVFFWIAYVLYLFWFHYYLQRPVRNFNKITTVLCLLTIIVYIIRMITMYPEIAPMNYYPGNLLHKIAGYLH